SCPANFDTQYFFQHLKRFRPTAIHFEAIWSNGALYESKLLPKVPGLGNRDLLRETIPLVHQEGIKYFAYTQGQIFAENLKPQFEQWATCRQDGKLTIVYGSMITACPNSPWREFTYKQVRELFGNYEIDGLFFDGPAFFAGACYCRYCREKFQAQYGAEIPPYGQISNPLWKKFILFRYESMHAFIRDLKAAAESVRPDAIVYINARGLNGYGRNCARDVTEMAEFESIAGAEAFEYYYSRNLDRPVWAQSATAKLVEGAARRYDKPAVVFVTFSVRPFMSRPLPAATLRSCVAQTLANGAGIWFELGYNNLAYYGNEEPEALAQAYDLVRNNMDCFAGTDSNANVAVLWSRRAGDYYDADPEEVGDWVDKDSIRLRTDPKRCYLSAFRGLCDIMVREHIPYDLIFDNDLTLERLARYKTVLLGNAACLSDAACEALRQYVAQGGGLVASYHASLFDEWGERRPDFGLAEVIGARIGSGEVGGYLTLNATDHPVLKNVRRVSPPLSFNLAVESLDPAGVLASYQGDKQPGIIARESGKGRVVYFSGSPEDRFWNLNLIEYQHLVANAARWTARELPVEIDTPAMVETVLRRKKNTGALILHLLNYTGTMARPIEKIIPAQTVPARVAWQGQAPSKVRTLVGGQSLPFTLAAG
ncbi:MAG: beta-galactosidase trimerization domain-containing protein, partial [Kiritimatiellae bacterium]|nr:beta-galactosidase trimerization domain-containing protein [Kiritimatiellia bacterium]